MKVRVNSAKCSGYGLCHKAAPEIFKLDEWGFAYVETEEVPPDLEESAREGARMCPESAISVEENTTRQDGSPA